MITMIEIRNVLFREKKDQESLLSAMKLEGSDFSEALDQLLLETDEVSLQKILAPFLRAKAVKYLRESETFAHWRNQLKQRDPMDLERFFTQQGKNCVYGTDECALALAQLFNVSLQVTIIDSGYSYTSNTAEESRPIFHINNQLKRHWYIYNGYPEDTFGDGNCLFNSFAQILRNNLLSAQYPEAVAASAVKQDSSESPELEDAKSDVIRKFFQHIEIYQTQDSLRAKFNKLPRLSIEELADRIVNLPKAESIDHLSALKVAVCEKVIQKHPDDARDESIDDENKMNPQLLEAGKKLIAAIEDMYNHGIELKNKKEGQIAIDLATQLKTMVETAMNNGFYKKTNATMTFPKFETEFTAVLNSKNAEMSKYRFTWDAVVLNIAIALTGVGLFVLAGKLIYSQVTEGHALLFFQKAETTLEGKVKAVKAFMDVEVEKHPDQQP